MILITYLHLLRAQRNAKEIHVFAGDLIGRPYKARLVLKDLGKLRYRFALFVMLFGS